MKEVQDHWFRLAKAEGLKVHCVTHWLSSPFQTRAGPRAGGSARPI